MRKIVISMDVTYARVVCYSYGSVLICYKRAYLRPNNMGIPLLTGVGHTC